MLTAGWAKRDITPKHPVHLGGFGFRRQRSDGVREPLCARALCLDDGRQRVVLVSTDLLSLPDESVERLRGQTRESGFVEEQNLLLCATHTHSGPVTDYLGGCCGPVDTEWLSWMEQQVGEVIGEAVSRVRPVRIGTGVGRLPGIAVNRRKIGEDGKAILAPNPDGVTDDQLTVLRIDDAEGNTCGVVTNFATHFFLGLSEPSWYTLCADLPGAAMSILENRNIFGLYTNGAAGNLNSVDLGGTDVVLRKTAGDFCRIVEDTLANISVADDSVIASHRETVQVPLMPAPSESELENLLADFEQRHRQIDSEKEDTSNPNWMLEHFATLHEHEALIRWAQQTLQRTKADSIPTQIDVEVQVLRIGDMAVIAVPAEVFIEETLDLQERSIAPCTIVVGYANGSKGYIGTKQSYDEGGYEVEASYRLHGDPARVVPETSEMLKTVALGAIENLWS